MKRYKVLNKDLTSPFQNFQFELNKKYVCNDFDDNPNIACSTGFYATKIDGLPYSFNINRKVFECGVSGKRVEINQYKCRYEKFKLIREIPFDEIKEKSLEVESRIGYKLSEVLFPVNPLLLKPKKIDYKLLLKNWASVRDSVGTSVWASVWDSARDSVWASVGDSVWASVRDSVRDSVWDSVWDSVRDSVWDSVGAYMSSLFPNIKQWKYIKHEIGGNPFQSGIDLWRAGYVPSFDGRTWRLHTGKNAKIIYEISQ